MDRRSSTRSSRSSVQRAAARLRRGAADPRARVRAGAAARRSRRCTRSSTARSSLLAPEDADARDAAEAAAWFLGDERVALLPSRGVHWGSGLEPPPHLVGERARALDVLAAGGLVCASAAALAEGMPPRAARPAPIRIAAGRGARPRAAGRVARARRLRARRARRGARPVRGSRRSRRRLSDDRPRAAAHRVLRRRDRADARVLAVHAARAARRRGRGRSTRPPSGASTSWSRRSPTTDEVDPDRPERPRRAAARPARISSGSQTRCAAVWEEEGLEPVGLSGADRARPAPARPAVRLRGAAARARRARARRRPRTS